MFDIHAEVFTEPNSIEPHEVGWVEEGRYQESHYRLYQKPSPGHTSGFSYIVNTEQEVVDRIVCALNLVKNISTEDLKKIKTLNPNVEIPEYDEMMLGTEGNFEDVERIANEMSQVNLLHTFQEGTKVRIVANTFNSHDFEIGEIGVVLDSYKSGNGYPVKTDKSMAFCAYDDLELISTDGDQTEENTMVRVAPGCHVNTKFLKPMSPIEHSIHTVSKLDKSDLINYHGVQEHLTHNGDL